MQKIRVGVLRGGPSAEYDVSLKTGGSVLSHLPEHYLGRDILIDRSGVWHLDGLPVSHDKLPKNIDVVFNALHGAYGEDGQVQNLLDSIGLPYTGSGHMASAIGMNKTLAKEHFRSVGLRVPHGVTVAVGEGSPEYQAGSIFEKISSPWVVKPVSGGSSLGLFLAKNFDQLVSALENCAGYADKILVEQYIKGREATVGVVENFRDHEVYVLMPTEIVRPGNKEAWDYTDKYSGETELICPGRFDEENKRFMMAAALKAHQSIGARHYSRSDFIVSPRGIYILEINTLPGMTEHSLLPKALDAAGCPYPQFLDHLLNLALKS